jgi:hypothetical protein
MEVVPYFVMRSCLGSLGEVANPDWAICKVLKDPVRV